MVGSFVLLMFARACGVIRYLFHFSSHGALVHCQKCLEEKNEILQGKLSQLEEHLARLQENPPQEKGEVLGDVLQVGMRKSSRKTCVLCTGVGVGPCSVCPGSGQPSVPRGAMVPEESY